VSHGAFLLELKSGTKKQCALPGEGFRIVHLARSRWAFTRRRDHSRHKQNRRLRSHSDKSPTCGQGPNGDFSSSDRAPRESCESLERRASDPRRTAINNKRSAWRICSTYFTEGCAIGKWKVSLATANCTGLRQHVPRFRWIVCDGELVPSRSWWWAVNYIWKDDGLDCHEVGTHCNEAKWYVGSAFPQFVAGLSHRVWRSAKKAFPFFYTLRIGGAIRMISLWDRRTPASQSQMWGFV